MRTTVFTKGCPLDCRWCQNPESLSPKQEIWYEAKKCIGCLDCIRACQNSALEPGESGVKINRDKCAGCGICAEICPAKSLALTGTAWTVDGLVREVMKDKAYYDEFNGGVTVSGGEPLMHIDFLTEFFQELKSKGIHTAIDTCGCVPEEAIVKILPYTDMILYDIKLIDSGKHKELTGRDNKLIFDNLKMIAAHRPKKALWIRTPLIPGATFTKENIIQTADFIVENILCDIDIGRWELCAFNPACSVKYAKMQRAWNYEGIPMLKRSDIEIIKESALSRGIPEDKLIITGIIKQE